MINIINFSRKIKRMRKDRGLNQEKLAKLSGLPLSEIKAIEALERKTVEYEDAARIMKALKVKVA